MVHGWLEFLLIALPFTPAVGSLVVGLLPIGAVRALRAIGWTFSILTLLIWAALHAWLPNGSGLLVSVNLPWVPDLGIGLHFGLDSTGSMMAGMISFVTMGAVVGTLPSLPELNRHHLVSLLLAECGMLGVVTSWDLILFIAFWEVTLVPFFFLMGRGPTRAGVAAATRFFVTSVASSVIMWVGVLLLVRSAGLPRTFDLVELTNRIGCHHPPSLAAVWFFVPAFLMRMAVFPLHTWFPAVQAEVPTAASILLAGGVLPLGGFGVIHVMLRLFGHELGGVGYWFTWIGLGTALGGGLASLVQRDLKRLLAYAIVAQMGLVLLGLGGELNQTGRQGGMMMLIATGLGGASLFLFAGVLTWARSSQRIWEISGLWRARPTFSGLAFTGVASLAALPGTLGFAAAWLILKGCEDDIIKISLIAGSLLVTGASVLWVFRRVSGGSYQEEMWSNERWPRKRQASILLLLAAVILGAGVAPGLLMDESKNLLPNCPKQAEEFQITQEETAPGNMKP